MKTTTTKSARRRQKPEPGEMIFQTRHLRRDLHARMNVIKAKMNGALPTGTKQVQLDVVLNRVIEAGLMTVEHEESHR